MRASHLESGGRYPVLRTLGILYLVGGALALVGGIFAASWALLRAPNDMGERMVYAMIILAGTFFVVLTMLAVAEFLKLMLDIEHNTRMSAGGSMTTGELRDERNAQSIGGPRGKWLNGDETAEAALLRGH